MILFASPLAAAYLLALTFVLGLVMGSALNCLALRLVSGERWAGGRSHCAACGHVLSAADLVPVLSYLLLHGRCRYCGQRISPRYLRAELMLGAVYVSLLLRYDVSWEAACMMVLGSCLFCLSLVDLDIQIIPDRFLVIAAAVRIVYILLTTHFSLGALWQSLWPALALGGAVLALSLVMDKLLHRESMGGGDIKLLFVLGLYFNLPECFFLLIAACLTGIALAMTLGAKKGTAFPFAPALSIATWLTALFATPITTWYLGLF